MRRGTWAAVRIPFLAILVFTTTTLVVTLLHLDRFHFGSPVPLARFAAWFWLAIYVVVPIAMVVILVLEERRRVAPPERVPLPVGLRVALLTQGAVMLAVGVPLLVRPELSAALWPWMLTPLTARMVAAWLLGFGVAVVLAGREGDLGRLDIAAPAYGLLAVLELVVLVRYPETVRWDSPAAWVYIAVAVSILISSAYGLSRLRGGRPAERRRLARPDGLP
jgi:hypothetical protein